ncbi:MAG: hypothetical protein ABI600_01300 [Luteolibacter sp.]
MHILQRTTPISVSITDHETFGLTGTPRLARCCFARATVSIPFGIRKCPLAKRRPTIPIEEALESLM